MFSFFLIKNIVSHICYICNRCNRCNSCNSCNSCTNENSKNYSIIPMKFNENNENNEINQTWQKYLFTNIHFNNEFYLSNRVHEIFNAQKQKYFLTILDFKKKDDSHIQIIYNQECFFIFDILFFENKKNKLSIHNTNSIIPSSTINIWKTFFLPFFFLYETFCTCLYSSKRLVFFLDFHIHCIQFCRFHHKNNEAYNNYLDNPSYHKNLNACIYPVFTHLEQAILLFLKKSNDDDNNDNKCFLPLETLRYICFYFKTKQELQNQHILLFLLETWIRKFPKCFENNLHLHSMKHVEMICHKFATNYVLVQEKKNDFYYISSNITKARISSCQTYLKNFFVDFLTNKQKHQKTTETNFSFFLQFLFSSPNYLWEIEMHSIHFFYCSVLSFVLQSRSSVIASSLKKEQISILTSFLQSFLDTLFYNTPSSHIITEILSWEQLLTIDSSAFVTPKDFHEFCVNLQQQLQQQQQQQHKF